MRHRRTLIRSLAVVVTWLLYACGNTPTAPPAEPAPTAEAGPVAARETAPTPGETSVVDPLLRWALEPAEAETGHDARIARAILELTEERKEIRP